MTLAIALIVPWLFWGTLMVLLFLAGRSWFNLLLIPVGTSIVIFVAARLSSDAEALWASLILHGLLLVFFAGSFLRFWIKDRKK